MRLSRLLFALTFVIAGCGDGTEEQAAEPAATRAAASAPVVAPPSAVLTNPPVVADAVAPAAASPGPAPTPEIGARAIEPGPAAAPPEPAPADPVQVTPAPAANPAGPAEPAAAPLDGIEARPAVADPAAGQSYAARCAACHSFEEGGEARVGPTLFGVFGNRVGADLNFAYSEAFQRLRDEGAIWTADRLEAFLADPAAAIAGTAMTVPMVRDEEDRINLVAWMATLVPAGDVAVNADGVGADLLARIAAADPAAGVEQSARCAGCHSFGAGAPTLIGPNLYGIIGAPMGRTDGFAYSFALRQRRDEGGVWTYDLLDAFLLSPQAAVPGTSMGFTGLRDDEARAALIAWLRTQADEPFPIPARVGVVTAGLRPTAFLRQQASNGEATYGACDGCHGTDLRGIDGLGPPLVGAAFAEHWFGGNAYDLFEYVRRNMPPNNRRGLTDFQYINVVAYILRENGFVANFEAEEYLPIGADELRGIGLYQY